LVSNDIGRFINKLSRLNILFLQIKFQYLPDVVYINRVSLPENYRRSTFIALYRLFKDISYVAIDKSKEVVIGYILNKLDEGESFYYKDKIVKKGHIFSVAVLPEYRGYGIGWGLVALGLYSMIKKGISEVYLEVRKSNSPAIALYKKFGMDVVGIVDAYYEDGEDALVMASPLSEFKDYVEVIVDEFVNQGYIREGDFV